MGKKWIFLFIIMLISSAIASDVLTGEVITGETITGKATSQGTEVSIFVRGIPLINIINPENKTYLRSQVYTDYSASQDADNVTYSIDGAANVTISNPTNIVYSIGQRFLEMYANSATHTGKANVTFTIDPTILVINYTEFNGSTGGSSTDFYDYAYEDLLYMGGIILENTNYGKIEFNENINVENDSNNSDKYVDINAHVDVGDNNIRLNSTALPNFNKQSTITLYNISYTDPQMLIDGAVCPITICMEVSYSGNTYVFNVTGFSTYSLRETPGDLPPSGGGGGGGGGGGNPEQDLDFILPPPFDIGQNDETVIPVTLVNRGENTIFRDIALEAITENEGIFPSFANVTITDLRPGEEQTVMLFIESTNVELGNVEIELFGHVNSPRFSASETLFLRSVESVGKVEVLERILLAQELFSENPECLELGDLLIQAQNLLDSGSIKDSRTLVQEAILRCRQLVANKEYPSLPEFGNFDAWRTPIEIALILIVITLIIFSLFRRQRIDLRKAKAAPRKGFFRRIFGGKKRRKKKFHKKSRRSKISNIEVLEPMSID